MSAMTSEALKFITPTKVASAPVRSSDAHGAPKRLLSPRTGAPLEVVVSMKAHAAVDDALCTVSFIWPSGYLCTELVLAVDRMEPGSVEVAFQVPRLAMQRGLYTVDLSVSSRGKPLMQQARVSPFRVTAGVVTRGDFHMEHRGLVRHGKSREVSSSGAEPRP